MWDSLKNSLDAIGDELYWEVSTDSHGCDWCAFCYNNITSYTQAQVSILIQSSIPEDAHIFSEYIRTFQNGIYIKSQLKTK